MLLQAFLRDFQRNEMTHKRKIEHAGEDYDVFRKDTTALTLS